MRLLVLLFWLLGPAPATGGAWPREAGGWFLSSSVQMTRTEDGGVGWAGTYLEYGATPRLTLGLDAGHAIGSALEDPGWQALLFGRYDLAPDGPLRIGAGLGAGVTSDGVDSRPLLRANLAIGRGFDSRYGGGWAEADLQAVRFGGETAWKLDTTAGLSPRGGRLLFLQAQTAKFPGAETQLRLLPTLVQRFGPVKVEFAATVDAAPETRFGLKLGLWREF